MVTDKIIKTKLNELPSEAYGMVIEYLDYLIFRFNHKLNEEDSPEEYDELLKELLMKRLVSHRENPGKGTTSEALRAKLSAKYGW